MSPLSDDDSDIWRSDSSSSYDDDDDDDDSVTESSSQVAAAAASQSAAAVRRRHANNIAPTSSSSSNHSRSHNNHNNHNNDSSLPFTVSSSSAASSSSSRPRRRRGFASSSIISPMMIKIKSCCTCWYQRQSTLLPRWCNSFSTTLLCITIVLWILASWKKGTTGTKDIIITTRPKPNGIIVPATRTTKRPTTKQRGFLQTVKRGFYDIVGKGMDEKTTIIGQKKKGGSTEELPLECEPAPWQLTNHVNCNEFHSIDLLRDVWIPSTKSSSTSTSSSTTQNNRPLSLGYVDSGLWRLVWAIPDFTVQRIILKMMKQEHDVTSRNFDRHRRDAIVMDVLTSHPNVVNGYGYCGNSVLTEFLPLPLAKLTLDSQKPLPTSFQSSSSSSFIIPTRETAAGKLKLALGVVQGVNALHSIPGGPIVHADLQSKQFLIDPTTGIIKINDFNRCRFMATHNVTHQSCSFRIPTSPGKARSPEEYAQEVLTEKLDIYSTANILMEILTGMKTWDEYGTTQAKHMIKKGIKPNMDLRGAEPLEEDLFQLTLRAYTRDPVTRISAAELQTELEALAIKYKVNV